MCPDLSLTIPPFPILSFPFLGGLWCLLFLSLISYSVEIKNMNSLNSDSGSCIRLLKEQYVTFLP